MATIAQSVQRLATSWTVRGSNSGGAGYFRACPDRPTQPPVQWVKRQERGVDHTPHLAPRLKEEQSYISPPPLGLQGQFQGKLHLFSGLLLCSLFSSIFSLPSAHTPPTHLQHFMIYTASNIPPVVIMTAYFCLQKVFLKIQRQFSFSANFIVSSGYNVPLNYYLLYKFLHEYKTKSNCISFY